MIKCPYCGGEIDVTNRISGDAICCPHCDRVFIIRFIAKENKNAE